MLDELLNDECSIRRGAIIKKIGRLMQDQSTQNGKSLKQGMSETVLQPRCPSCGRSENIIWVHGHGQCAHCKINVMPCCDGEICQTS